MGSYDSETERSSRSRKNKSKKRKHKRSYSRSSSSDSVSSSGSSRSSSCDRSSSSLHRSSKHSSKSKKNHKHRQRSPSRHSRSHHSPSRRRRSRSPSEDKSSSRSRRNKSSSSSLKHSSKHKKHKRRHRSSSSDSSRGRGDYSRGTSRDKASRGASREKSYSRGASRDKDRSIKKECSSSIDKVNTARGSGRGSSSTFPPPLTPVKEEAATGGDAAAFTELSESDKLKRERQIADIQESSFTAAAFKSSRGDKSRATAASCKAEGGVLGDDFNFGTSAEMRSRAAKLLPIDDNSIFSPYLFGDPEEREEKFLKRVMSIRQRVYDNMTAAGTVC